MHSPGLNSPHPGHPRLAARINQARGAGIAGVANCGSHNPLHGDDYWKLESEGTLLYYSKVVISETKPGEVGTGRNAIFRVTPALVAAELLS